MKMIYDIMLLIITFLTLIASVVGWIVNHYLSLKREELNERRGKNVNYLIDAYMKLALSVQRHTDDPEDYKYLEDLESALTIMQILGSHAQNKMVQDFILEWDKQKQEKGKAEVSINNLLEHLRTSLREELGKSPIEAPIRWFRAKETPQSSPEKATQKEVVKG
jgi:hypothetical protein